MFGLGLPEIIVITLAVGILFFGSGKMVELARSLGRLSGEFRKGKRDIEQELSETEGDKQKEASHGAQKLHGSK